MTERPSAIIDAALRPRPVWRSERAYVLATIAGVVGLGNLWRFPYMAGRHGGGTFVVAYVVSVAAIAVPLAAVESAAGSLVRRSPVGAFRRAAGPAGSLIGWSVVGLTGMILSYYLVITGWTLGYAVDAFRGHLRSFAGFVDGRASLWFLLAVSALCVLTLVRGVDAIDRISRVLVPILVLIVLGLAIYAQSLDGAADARSFYFGVDGNALRDPTTWQAAAGQAFYSLGVGQGILIAYGSFVPAGTNLIRSTALIAAVNGCVSLIAGAMVISVAFSFDLPPSTGSELSFTAFPQIFAQVPGGGALAIVFFSLLLLAGFTSCLSATLVVTSTLRDEFRLRHRTAVLVTMAALTLAGIPSALSFTDVGLTIGGVPFLDRVDQLAGSGVVVVLGLGGAAVLARRLPRRVMTAAFNADGLTVRGRKLTARWVLRWAFVLPAIALAGYGAGTTW